MSNRYVSFIALLFALSFLILSCGGRHSRDSADMYGYVANDTFPDSLIVRTDSIGHDAATYICGFSGESIGSPADAAQSNSLSPADSSIEWLFRNLWFRIVGGDTAKIKIMKDFDASGGYKYAAATVTYTPDLKPQRVIYYKSKDLNGEVLNELNGWLIKTIALHEMGHHINEDALSETEKHYAELKADDYAGFQLAYSRYKLHASLDTIIMVYNELAELNPRDGYPTRQERIEELKKGWTRGEEPFYSLVSAMAKTMDKYGGGIAETKQMRDWRNIGNGVRYNAISLPEDYITLSLDKDGKPYKTIKKEALGDTVKVHLFNFHLGDFYVDRNFMYYKDTDSLTAVGSIAECNRSQYPYMIYDKYYNYMYIDKKNQLITYTREFSDRYRIDTVGLLYRFPRF